MKSDILDYKEYKRVRDRLDSERKEIWDKYTSISTEISEELKKLVNLKGKFLKIDDDGGILYMFVTSQFESKYYTSNIPAIILRGIGFKANIGIYQDDTYMNWDEMTDHYIRLNEEFIDDMNKITEIDKDEFNNSFEKMLSDVRKEHYDFQQ